MFDDRFRRLERGLLIRFANRETIDMFRRGNLIVTQWEHSRLSGTIASFLGAASGVSNPPLCGAIALHDWPHFPGTGVADVIEIGHKSIAQQQALLSRLSQPLPLGALTELIVRLHWQRLSQDDAELQDAIDEQRIDSLRQQLGLSLAQMKRIDQWTDLCDMFAFYLSRGDSAEGNCELADPQDQVAWDLSWTVTPTHLDIRGLPLPADCEVSLLAFDADGYPGVLQPSFVRVSCSSSPAVK